MSTALRWALITLACLVSVGLRPLEDEGKAADSKRPNVPIDFVGFLPGTQDRTLAGEFPVEFSIYLSPTGGRPAWSERQAVTVSQGQIAVKLGLTTPIPWSLTVANFKFVSARIAGGAEVLPRMPVVNVVFAATETISFASKNYSNAGKLESDPRPGSTWSDALDTAHREGKRLPSYVEWYSAAAAGELRRFSGQYEWSIPWVYDTASHGELNDHFRGRFEGCDYMDLDPMLNMYPYRLCDSAATKGK